jgi:hypothetical protein
MSYPSLTGNIVINQMSAIRYRKRRVMLYELHVLECVSIDEMMSSRILATAVVPPENELRLN